MLDVSAQNLLEEIEAAEKLRDDHLKSLESQIERFHGPSWRGQADWSSLSYDPKNRAFQHISRILPDRGFNNPRFTCSSKRGPKQREVANAIRLGMNRWAIDAQIQTTAEQVITDAEFTYGVLAVAQMPDLTSDPGASETRMRPQMRRLSVKEFGIDPIAKDVRDARFQFHVWVADKDDLLALAKAHPEQGWDADAIERCAVDTGKDKLSRPKQSGGSPEREEIVAYSVWVPEYELDFGPKEMASVGAQSWRDAGYHGTVFTIAVGVAQKSDDTASEEIRKPQPYYGPPDGPYQIVGGYYVPDTWVPLGELTAVEAQSQELNTHARAYLKSAARRKKIAIVGANDTALQAIVKNAEDGDVVASNVAEIAKNLVELELGGATAEQRLAIMDLEVNLDDALGTSNAVRGTVTGDATASENVIAAQAASARQDWNRKKFYFQFGLAARKVAWFLYHDDRVVFPLGDEAVAETGLDDPWFHGGTHGENSGATFADLELEIEAKSMSAPDDAKIQAETMGFLQALDAIIQKIVMFPDGGFERLIPILAERFNALEIADALNVPGMIADAQMQMMAAAAMAGGGMGGAPGGAMQPAAGGQPQLGRGRLGGDMGLSNSMQRGMKGGLAAGGPPDQFKAKGNPKPGKAGGAKKPAMAGAA